MREIVDWTLRECLIARKRPKNRPKYRFELRGQTVSVPLKYEKKFIWLQLSASQNYDTISQLFPDRKIHFISLHLMGAFNKSNVGQRGVYSYRQRYASSQWSKCCRPTRRSQVSPQQILSVRVHTTLNHIRFVFYHNIKDNEINLCQDL